MIMDKFEKLAAKLIDLIEHDIRRANPEVDAIAMTKEGNTLLHGENYYDLENKIAEELRGSEQPRDDSLEEPIIASE